MSQRDQFDRLVAEPGLMGTAVEELLRFESPLQLNNRRLTAPLALGDTTLPAGSFVTLCIGAANHDPAVGKQPGRLDVARKPNNHLAFGQGAHACSGMNVARLESRVAIGRLAGPLPSAGACRHARTRPQGAVQGLCQSAWQSAFRSAP